jgi:hypothetical protein
MLMKTKLTYLFATLFTAALALNTNAQITPRPVTWTGTNGLNAFGSNLVSATDQTAFNATGLNRDDTSSTLLPAGFVGPATPSIFFNPLGGSVKVVFLGETAGWSNDFGFVTKPTILTNPANYNPLVVNSIGSAYGTAPGLGLLTDNTFTTVTYGAGQTLDFFVNAVGGPGNPGGTWFAFGSPNQFAGGDTDIQTKYWNTWINGIPTLIVGFEDANNKLDSFQSHDFTDFIVAFQGLSSPVPEPSTYGLMAALSLIALAVVRHRKSAVQKTA